MNAGARRFFMSGRHFQFDRLHRAPSSPSLLPEGEGSVRASPLEEGERGAPGKDGPDCTKNAGISWIDGQLNLNSSVDHDENSEYSVKTRTYRELCFHPMGESGATNLNPLTTETQRKPEPKTETFQTVAFLVFDFLCVSVVNVFFVFVA
jgi:hypothetical protein